MSTSDFHIKNVAEKRGIAKRQTRRSPNANITYHDEEQDKSKKGKVVKEDSFSQTRQIVVVFHGISTKESNTGAS
jgi:hypothetical protein